MARADGPEMKLFDPKHRREMSKGQRLALVGTELSVSIFLGLFGGHWLDERLATRPWLTLVGLLLGIAAGFKNLYEVARREQARMSRERAQRDAEAAPPTNKPE
ncbi:MAG: AtpZ/AtpI family protein [Sandaracinaceae bacterium]|nr:AtpZ/AtpI family protein [Sandaracinaceae bacterium]